MTLTDTARTNERAERLESVGTVILRYGLVAVIAWIGAMKLTAYEAEAIQGLIAASPFLGWLYSYLSVTSLAAAIGIFEIAIAIAIVAKPVAPRLAALGSLLAIGMFATTLSFLLSTPGAFEPSLGGFPALSVVPGQFLIKDVVLLGASIWALGDALRAHASVSA